MIGCNLELLKKNILMLSNHYTHSSEYHERMRYGKCNGHLGCSGVERSYIRLDDVGGYCCTKLTGGYAKTF